jgi:CBS domain-containing protein
MLGQHLSWMPVCDEDRRVVGVLGRSDLLTDFLRDDASIRAEIVDDVLRFILLADPARVLGAVQEVARASLRSQMLIAAMCTVAS